jgi:hypothetical protein
MAELQDLAQREAACPDQACKDALAASMEGKLIEFGEILDAAREPDAAAVAIVELRAIKEFACKCHDADCVAMANASFEKWAARHQDTRGTDAQTEEAGRLGGEVSECLARVSAGE